MERFLLPRKRSHAKPFHWTQRDRGKKRALFILRRRIFDVCLDLDCLQWLPRAASLLFVGSLAEFRRHSLPPPVSST